MGYRRALPFRERAILQHLHDRVLAYDNFVDAASASLAKAGSTGLPVALLVADVDHFQRLATVHGQEYAREAMQAIVGLVRRGLRRGDVASHAAGDEVVVMLHAGPSQAREVAERLCAAVRGHPFPRGPGGFAPQISISVGVAVAPDHGSSFAALHAAADRARLRIKAQGRDGAALATTRGAEPPHRPLDIDRFAGRAEERRQLTGWLEEAVNGRPQVVAITGEVGAGTSMLVRQLQPEIRLRGGSLVRGRCRPAEAGDPYGVFVSLVQALQRLPTPPRNAWRELPHLVPELAETHAPQEPGTGSKYRLVEELTEYIRLSSGPQPLLVQLDDMQWADAASWDTLEHLVQNLDNERVLICLTIRQDPSITEVAEHRKVLARSELYHELQLSRLTRDEVKRWLESALHQQDIGRELLAFLYRQTEGNPLFLVELLRTLAEEGLLWNSGERWEWAPVSELRLPVGLVPLIARRLSRFSASTQAVLSTAAVIGREFDIGLVVAAGAGSEAAVELALSEALAAGLLRSTYERESGGYAFAHAQVVEVLVSAVAPDRMRQLHERVAQALERRSRPRPTEIAMHYDRAGASAAAYRLALEAASRAEAVYAHTAARESLLVAARNATSPGELAEVRVRLAQLAEIMGRFDEAEELCDLAIEWFEGQGDKPRALTLRRMRERARKELGQPARVLLDALLSLDDEARALGFERERVPILMMLSQSYGRLGDTRAAERIASECVRMAERVGDQALIAEALTRLGITVEWEDPDRAREIYGRALGLFESVGDTRGQTRCHNNLGNLALHRSNWDEARASYTTAISLARAAGMPDFWGAAAANLGVISHRSGDYDRARELFGEALGLFAMVKNSELQLYALCNMAHIEWESGAWESGAELYEATASLAQRIGAADVEIASMAGEGLCLIELGRADSAKALYAQLEERVRGRDGWFQGREFAEALGIRLLLMQGKLDEALARFEGAAPMAEGVDVYSAAWLTAVSARSLSGVSRDRIRPWLDRYESRVEALGYSEIIKRFKELRGR